MNCHYYQFEHTPQCLGKHSDRKQRIAGGNYHEAELDSNTTYTSQRTFAVEANVSRGQTCETTEAIPLSRNATDTIPMSRKKDFTTEFALLIWNITIPVGQLVYPLVSI
jgi:hypothetical protein